MMTAVSLLPAEVKVRLKCPPSGALQVRVPLCSPHRASSAQREPEKVLGKRWSSSERQLNKLVLAPIVRTESTILIPGKV